MRDSFNATLEIGNDLDRSLDYFMAPQVLGGRVFLDPKALK